MRKIPNEVHTRNFDTLLSDACISLVEANKSQSECVKKVLIRSSIISSTLLLETSANILIESLNLDKNLHTDIDRLPFIGKFRFYLDKNNEKLNMGDSSTQKIIEIKKLRDSYVHMKRKQQNLERKNKYQSISQHKLYNSLKIPQDIEAWNIGSAVTVMKAVHSFLANIMSLSKLTKEETTNLLLSTAKIPSRKNNPMTSLFCSYYIKEVESLGVNFSYIILGDNPYCSITN